MREHLIRRRVALRWAGALWIVLTAVLAAIDARMRSTGGPGLLGLEFARTKNGFLRALREYGASGRSAARWGQIVDYAYVLSYVSYLTLAVGASASRSLRRGSAGIARLGPVALAFPLVAGISDFAQNTALLVGLGGSGAGWVPAVSFICGATTTALIVATLLYLLFARAARAAIGGRR